MSPTAPPEQFAPASGGGEQRVRTLVRLTQRLARFGLGYRWRELQLLAVPCAVVIAGGLLLAMATGSQPGVGTAAFWFIVLLLMANVGLSAVAPSADQYLLPLAAFPASVGFVFSARSRPDLLWDRLIGQTVGVVAIVALLLLATRVRRPEPVSSARWRSATALPLPEVAQALLGAGVVALALFAWRRDMGVGLIALFTLLVPVYVAYGRGQACLAGAVLSVALALAGTALLAPELWATVSPQAGPAPQAALDAISRGGLFGVGLGQGQLTPAEGVWRLASIAEEIGLAGLAAVLAGYAALAARGLRVALILPDTRSRLATAALSTALASQAAVAAAANLVLLPQTELPAPFLTAHGAPLAVHLLVVGMLLYISCYVEPPPAPPPATQSTGTSSTSGTASVAGRAT